MRHEIREIKETDACPICGCSFLVFNNKGNTQAWVYCEECERETPLGFREPYKGSKHGYWARTGQSHSYVKRGIRDGN